MQSDVSLQPFRACKIISQITLEENNALVKVEGEIDMFTSPNLRDTLLPFFKKKVQGIIVDLTQVSFMDSSGIATLVEGLQWSKKENSREALGKIVEERFDLKKMSQLSLARHWKERTESEKQEFVDLFCRLLKDTYLSKMEGYTDEKVIFLKERIKKKKAQIDTKIITQTVEIPINYRMFTKKDNQWRVYDVVIEGVSLIANYRSQFNKMLEKDSFEDLMDKLKKK